MTAHVYMAVRFEMHSFLFQQRALTAPARCCTPCFVDYTMAGKQLGSRGIAQRTPNHT